MIDLFEIDNLQSRVERDYVKSPAVQAESFPLPVYTVDMYPPHVSDLTVRGLIKELTHGDCLPSGAALRAALRERYGCSGGVARIYRLLAQARPRPAAPAVTDRANVDQAKLESELSSLRQSAQLSEYREQVHQARWAQEVDQLRQRVSALEPLAAQATRALESAELLRRQLYAAHVRIAALEQELLDKEGGGGEGG